MKTINLDSYRQSVNHHLKVIKAYCEGTLESLTQYESDNPEIRTVKRIVASIDHELEFANKIIDSLENI